MYIAAQKGHIDIVEKLIAAGCDVDKARTDTGATPLYIAANRGHIDIVEKLIAAGCDVDKAKTTTGTTPLFIAAQKGHIDIVKQLLENGANKLLCDSDGDSPLDVARVWGHNNIAALLK